MRTPLAWKNLTVSFNKFLLAAAGVGFAVVLMFMQIGFRNALIDSNVQVFRLFSSQHTDLIMLSRARYNISTEQRFPRYLLQAAAGIEGVQQVSSLAMERGTAQVQVVGHAPRPIRVLGMELSNPFFASKALHDQLSYADRHNAALLDSRSKPVFGFAGDLPGLADQEIELSGIQLPIVGYFELGTDFANDGTLLVSERLLAKYFPWRSPSGHPNDQVDIGLLHIEGSQDPQTLCRQIESLAPDQIDVRPMTEFIQREKDFWSASTPIGKIFFIGTLMGLVVGAIICYQIQFTDLSEHMPEFATLKAMGYGQAYFWSFIVCQSFYLACMGFLPGWLIAFGLYNLLGQFSGLIMEMTFWRVVLVWMLTMGMCLTSGILAIRRLFSTDPASLF
ncbi:MAG: FtsX-like permease family protein [Planctomycetales bacterium]|nr:FtsX-like permease family protein [Planctomycetales bacterium]